MPPNRDKNNLSRLLLSTPLFLDLIGRILQFFIGRVPNLLIVAFHVIPPALFAVIHGARIYRPRGILVFTCLCLGIGTLFESMSVQTSFPFGHYRFTDLMGPQIFGLRFCLLWLISGWGTHPCVFQRKLLSVFICDFKILNDPSGELESGGISLSFCVRYAYDCSGIIGLSARWARTY